MAAPYHARVVLLLRQVIGRPLLWWLIAGALLVHDVVGNLLTSYRPDAASIIEAGHR